MKNYIICSNDVNDFGYIHDLNLNAPVSTQETTLQITSINTLANFQILNAEDYITVETNILKFGGSVEIPENPEIYDPNAPPFDFGAPGETEVSGQPEMPDTTPGEAGTIKTFYAEPRVGLSWEAVPGMLNTWTRDAGIDIVASIGDLRRLCLVSAQKFEIKAMSYNFEVLFGCLGVQYPMIASEFNEWVGRRTTNADPIPVVLFQVRENWTCFYPLTALYTAPPITGNYVAVHYELEPYGDTWHDYKYANRWSIQWSITHWLLPEGREDWCTIDVNSGTIHLIPNMSPIPDGDTQIEAHAFRCIIQAKLFDGGPEPFMEREANFTAFHGNTGPTDDFDWNSIEQEAILVINKPLPILTFGEVATVSLKPTLIKGDTIHEQYRFVEYSKVSRWYLKDMSAVKFSGRYQPETSFIYTHTVTVHDDYLNEDNEVVQLEQYFYSADDVGQSVPIIALSQVGETDLLCAYTVYPDAELESAGNATMSFVKVPHDPQTRYLKMHITVINDLTEKAKRKTEAPAVGNPLSTPQLYMVSNCGSQVFQNSLTYPDRLTNGQISASIQNSFSAGYSIAAAGDAPVQLPTLQLNNLNFQLVDANFKPVKLLNPMYLTICITPVSQDANNDLSQWAGHLPLNAPTRAEKAQSDADAKVQADAQAQADAEAKEKSDVQALAFHLVVQVLAPIVQQQMVEQQVAMAQMQEQQLKEGVVQSLLQDETVREFLETLPENQVVPFIKKLAKQVLKQGMTEEQDDTQPIVEPTTDQQPPDASQQAPPQPETPTIDQEAIVEPIVQPPDASQQAPPARDTDDRRPSHCRHIVSHSVTFTYDCD
jgi:hypothetical protein